MPRAAARTQRSVETARALNPDIEVAVRSHNDEEAQLLQREVRAACSSAKVNLARSCLPAIAGAVAL